MVAKPKPDLVLLESISTLRLENVEHPPLEVRIVGFLGHVDVADLKIVGIELSSIYIVGGGYEDWNFFVARFNFSQGIV